MKTHSRVLNSRSVGHGLLLIVGLALSGNIASAKRPPKPPPEPESGYRLVDLVGLLGGQSIAWRINEAGWAVGEYAGPANVNHAFVIIPEDTDGDGTPDCWARDDDGDGINDLLLDLGVLRSGGTGQSEAYGVNDYGQVVGSSDVQGDPNTTPQQAFLWQPNAGEMLDLGKLYPDDPAIAWSINNLGQVVGCSLYATRGFLVNPLDTDGDETPDTWFLNAGNGINALMIDLGSASGGLPIDINHSGEVVGTLGSSDLGYHCGFLIRPKDVDGDGYLDWFSDADGGGINDLMILLPPPAGIADSFAAAIDQSGLIAGKSGDDVVLWHVDSVGGVSEFNLGQVKGYASTGVWDLNSFGQAVGVAGSTLRVGPPPKYKRAGWLSDNGSLIKLSDRIVDWGPFGPELDRAFSINDTGTIVGDMQWHAYIAIPTP